MCVRNLFARWKSSRNARHWLLHNRDKLRENGEGAGWVFQPTPAVLAAFISFLFPLFCGQNPNFFPIDQHKNVLLIEMLPK